MSENNTVPTGQSVGQILNAIADEQKRDDSLTLLRLMREVTGLEPQMWGSSIAGFGSYHYRYRYASGRDGDTMLVGFSPRQQNPTIYNMGGIDPDEQPFKKLGKYTTGKGCLYIKRLDDVDPPTLKRQIEASFTRTKERSAEHAAE